MTLPPPRFHAFKLSPEHRWGSIAEIVKAVQLAEKLGFDAVNLTEHLILPQEPGGPTSTDVWYDKFVLGGHLAAFTSRIRFMFYILVVPYHPPVATAKALATLDHVSGGRVTLGAGAGWLKGEFELLGVPYEKRGAITDEYLDAMKALWTQERPAFHGQFVNFEDTNFLPKCLQQPHIPIWIGGNSKAALRRAVAQGSGWAPLQGALGKLEKDVLTIKEGLAKAGRDPENFEFAYGLNIGKRTTWKPHASAATLKPDPAEEDVIMCPREAGPVIEAIERLRRAGFNNIIPRFSYDNATELMEFLEWFAAEVMSVYRPAAR